MNSNITPLFLLALSVGLFYTYINPGYAKMNELRVEQAQYQEALQRVQEIQTLRDELLTKYNSFSSDDIAKLQTLLPDSIDNVRLILDLNSVASRYGITLKNVKAEKPIFNDIPSLDSNAQTVFYGSEKVSIGFDSTYDNFLKFMKDLEQSLRLVDVSGVSFKSAQSGKYEYSVVLSTYWLKK